MQKILLATSVSILLTACGGGGGGGGGGSSSPTPTPIPNPTPNPIGDGSEIGQLKLGDETLDIDGLGFKTATVSGTTKDGKFSYNKGESIEFMLGDTVIGSLNDISQAALEKVLQGDYQIPTDAKNFNKALTNSANSINSFSSVNNFSIATLPNKNSLNGLHPLSNKIKLLLLLDADRDSSNGLDLSDWHSKLAGSQFNFNTSLYDHSEFLALFQNVNKPTLFHPTAIDVAEPLSYYTTVINAPVPSAKIDKLTLVNPVNALTQAHDLTYDALGRITYHNEDLRRSNNLDQPYRENTKTYQYDNFGKIQVETVLQKLDLDQSSPRAPYYGKETYQHSGYYNNIEGGVFRQEQKKYQGTNPDDLKFSGDEKFTADGQVPFLVTNYNYSSVTLREGENYGKYYRNNFNYQYDTQGRITDNNGTSTNFNADDSEIRTQAQRHESHSYSSENNQNIRTTSIDKAIDGITDGNIDITEVVKVSFDSKKRVSICTSIERDNNNSIISGRENRYTHSNNTDSSPISFTSFRDSDKDGTFTDDEKRDSKLQEYSAEGLLTKYTNIDYNGNKKLYTLEYVQAADDTTNQGKVKTLKQHRVYEDNGQPRYIDTYAYSYNQQGQLATIAISTMEGNAPVIANSSTTTFTYDSLGLKSYTTIKNEQETTVNLETTVLDQGVGYLIHQQLNNTINKYASSRNVDYRLKAELPSTINISRGCVF